MLREFLKPTDKPKFNLLIESISCLNHTFHCCSGKIESKSFGAEKALEDHLVWLPSFFDAQKDGDLYKITQLAQAELQMS